MKVELLLVGKTVNSVFVAGIADYAKRIGHYMPFNINVIPELKNTKNISANQQKEAEGELILKKLSMLRSCVASSLPNGWNVNSTLRAAWCLPLAALMVLAMRFMVARTRR